MNTHLLKKTWAIATLLCLHASIQSASESPSQGKKPGELKILSYNICTEARTFGTELDLTHRLPEILKMIQANDPDIICLQEVRSKVAETVTALLCANGYRTQYASNNGGSMSLGLMTAYKPATLFCENHETKWFSEAPRICSGNAWYEFGRIFTTATLRECDKTGMPTAADPLFVINTHLGLSEDEKEYSAKQLLAAIAPECFKRVVLVGDMNFFDDKNGKAQRNEYIAEGMQDALADVPGTFVGYSYDNFIPKAKADMPKLDGVFVRGDEVLETTVLLHDQLKDDLSNRDTQPSDHLPILLRLAKL